MSEPTGPSLSVVVTVLAILPAALYLFTRVFGGKSSSTATAPAGGDTTTNEEEKEKKEEPKTIMQPARTDLAPPKDDPFTQEQLKEFDGSNPDKPIYVAIKGTSQHLLRTFIRPIIPS